MGEDVNANMFNDYTVAKAVHAVNVVIQEALDDTAPSSYRLENEPPGKQASVVNGVRRLRMGMPLDVDHSAWCDDMAAMGWVLGDKKDPEADPPTHPCIKPWAELTPEEQLKSRLRLAIVREMTLP
jgi:hypothetical protein